MSNPKHFIIGLLAGAVGGFLAVIFIFPLAVKTNFLNTAAMLGKFAGRQQAKPAVITKIEEAPVVTEHPNYFSDAIGKAQPSIAAIQSFSSDENLVRSGSGIILTQDGLIATLNSLVPADAAVFQVVDSGKIYKAKVVFRDFVNNLAIISIPDANLPVVKFKSDPPSLAQNLLIFSKFVDFNKDSPIVEKTAVSQTDSASDQFKVSVLYERQLYGGAVIDNDADVLGLLDFRNQKPAIIFSKTVNDALNAYLTKNTKL